MTLKETFLEIKTYEEFDKRREEFRQLDWSDAEIRQHVSDIFPRVPAGYVNGVIYEVYKEKRNK